MGRTTNFHSGRTSNFSRSPAGAAVTTIFPKIMLSLVSYLSGCVAYAYFEGCDPLASGAVQKKDQVFPYLVLHVFRNVPGMAGLFVAAAFSGTMSTVSSGLNSLSAQLLQDFLIPLRPNLGSSIKHTFSKLAALLLGLAITSIAYMCLLLDGTVISMVLSFKGSLSGAVLGVFTLGMFFPWCNSKGALVGQITGTVIPLWISMGGIVHGKSPETQRKLPVSTECCNATNLTCSVAPIYLSNLTFTDTAVSNSSDVRTEYNPLYAMSFWYLAGLGVFITLTVGMLVSFLTGINDTSEVDPQLFCPIIDNPKLPKALRHFFRFGVPEMKSSIYVDEFSSEVREEHKLKRRKDSEPCSNEPMTALL